MVYLVLLDLILYLEWYFLYVDVVVNEMISHRLSTCQRNWQNLPLLMLRALLVPSRFYVF